MTEEMDRLKAATRKHKRATESAEAARKEVLDAALEALRAGERPTDVAAASPFTPAYIRRIAREHGIDPAPPGPKPRRSSD
ncbi:hypothetical protein IU501_34815 [Nocardia otitidiscaviarum]|uniref:hypothetical protein n=1 Tax=Nocardia otitidiscaviarum TaxID=1823 RepID=UPI0018950373|nr:hypothetical protein [Nocardia otitidiscaviarum]MBF6138144.1 hypothetical protein [Nocardia otitidiscaviarum]